ncbi:MAG: hypothetical protein U0840_10505 [Gemmataceae bacterium]
MRPVALICLLMLAALVSAADPSGGKQHEYRAADLFRAFPRGPGGPRGRDGRPVGTEPTARLRLRDSLSIIYPLTLRDVELFECSSGHADIRVSLAEDDKGLRVGVRASDRARNLSAPVSWRIVEINGREHVWTFQVRFD